jgi:uncharacterized membrane protein
MTVPEVLTAPQVAPEGVAARVTFVPLSRTSISVKSREALMEKLPGKVMIIVAPDATPVGVTKLISWLATVLILAEDRVSDIVVKAAAFATVIKEDIITKHRDSMVRTLTKEIIFLRIFMLINL